MPGGQPGALAKGRALAQELAIFGPDHRAQRQQPVQLSIVIDADGGDVAPIVRDELARAEAVVIGQPVGCVTLLAGFRGDVPGIPAVRDLFEVEPAQILSVELRL